MEALFLESPRVANFRSLLLTLWGPLIKRVQHWLIALS